MATTQKKRIGPYYPKRNPVAACWLGNDFARFAKIGRGATLSDRYYELMDDLEAATWDGDRDAIDELALEIEDELNT